MALKAVLYNLLLHFRFEPNEHTQIPLKLKRSAFTLATENGLQLELESRKN